MPKAAAFERTSSALRQAIATSAHQTLSQMLKRSNKRQTQGCSKQFCLPLCLPLSIAIEKGLQTEICNPLILLVRPAGFEPTTPWFVATYLMFFTNSL